MTTGSKRAWRSWLAAALWLVAAACALCLAAGALLVALRVHQADPPQPLVGWVLRAADGLVLGRVLDLDGADAEATALTEVLVTWTLAAVGYLVAGTLADRVVRV